jgi:hypothetical protein
MSFGIPLRSGAFVGAASVVALSTYGRTLVNDFRVVMPAGSTYTRTGSATGLSLAGVVETFAADAPQRTSRGLAIEAAQTNLSLRSQEFDQATWLKTGSSITADATAAPDGTTTADKLVENGSLSTHRVLNNLAVTVVAASTYTWSVFVKAGERTAVRVENNALSGATFDLANNGAVSSVVGSITTSVLALANGWFRLSITGLAATVSDRIIVNLVSGGTATYTGNGTSGAFIWGAQVELAATPSSYILTAAATATRGAPAFTEVVPSGRTKALLVFADGTTALSSGLTPGGTFDEAAAVIAASKGAFGVSELVSRAWQ